MKTTPSTHVDRSPASAPPPGSRGAPGESGSAFAELLELEPAWTAHAGGHSQKTKVTAPEGAARPTVGERPDDAAPEGDAGERPVAEAHPVIPPAPDAGAPHPAGPAPVVPLDALATTPAPAAPAPLLAVAIVLTPVAPAQAPAPAPAPAAPAATIDAGGATTVAPSPAPALHAAPTTAAQPAETIAPATVPAATPAAPTPSEADVPPARASTSERPARPVEAVRTPSAIAEPPAAATAATAPATPATGAAAAMAAAPATPAPAVPSAPGVLLHGAAEAVENTIRLASERGVRHARLALRPAELGGVEIHLRSTAAGLSARVLADAPEAMHLLRAAGGELTAALQRQGVELVELDFGLVADANAGPDASSREADDNPSAGSDRRTAAGADAPEDEDPTATTTTTTLELPDGMLVDVLA